MAGKVEVTGVSGLSQIPSSAQGPIASLSNLAKGETIYGQKGQARGSFGFNIQSFTFHHASLLGAHMPLK